MRTSAGLILCLVLLAFTSGAEGTISRVGAADISTRAEAFWRQAQDDLFAGITLSADQRAGVDAIIAEAAQDRARVLDLMKLVRAPGENDSPAKERAQAEVQKLKGRLHPEWRIDKMRELLSEEQRTVFDRNWRLRSDRLFAEEKRSHRKSAGR